MSEKNLVLAMKPKLLLLIDNPIMSPSACSDIDLDDESVDIFQNGFWKTVQSKNQFLKTQEIPGLQRDLQSKNPSLNIQKNSETLTDVQTNNESLNTKENIETPDDVQRKNKSLNTKKIFERDKDVQSLNTQTNSENPKDVQNENKSLCSQENSEAPHQEQSKHQSFETLENLTSSEKSNDLDDSNRIKSKEANKTDKTLEEKNTTQNETSEKIDKEDAMLKRVVFEKNKVIGYGPIQIPEVKVPETSKAINKEVELEPSGNISKQGVCVKDLLNFLRGLVGNNDLWVPVLNTESTLERVH